MDSEIDTKPLDSFPVIRSRNVDVIRETVTSSYGARRFDVPRHADGLNVRANLWQSKNIDLCYCSYGAEVELAFPATNFFRQQICLRGAGITRIGGIEKKITSKQTWVTPPEAPIDVSFGPGYEQLVLRVEAQLLTAKLAAIIGVVPAHKLEFDLKSAVDGPALATLRRMTVFFAGELDAGDTPRPSLAIAELEQALIISFLCNNRHNYSSLLEAGTRALASGQVRRAEEYIEAHWDRPIAVEDLVHVTSASARSLFREFRRSRGYSPMNFVKEVRLRRAKEMLSTGSNPSVTETAVACGFSNLGHFAKDYFKRFGERPSDVVRRVKGSALSRSAFSEGGEDSVAG